MPSFALALTFSVPVPLTERSHLAKIAAVSASLPSVPVTAQKPRERRRREIHRRQQAAESPRIRLQLYENYYKLLKGMKDAGEIKGGLRTRLMQLLGVSERTVRIYKQLSEQLIGREKQHLMRGKLPFVQARAIAAERNQKAAMLPDFEKAEKTKDKNLPAGSGE